MAGEPHIDLLDPVAFDGGQPHEAFAWLRDNDPVHWHEEANGPGYWAVTLYDDVKRVDRDAATFSSASGIMIPDATGALGGAVPRMMISMDPPDHTHFRRLVIPDFIPKAVRAMGPRVEAVAAEIVDGVVERGECDLVAEVAGLMPSYVIADLLGIPSADGVALYDLTETIHSTPDPENPAAGITAVIEMLQYAHGVWEDRRARPRDDLSTKLAHASVDGEPLSEVDFGMWFLLLVDAGGDTTRNLVATGTLALLEHPDQLELLRADLDSRLNPAIEELLRWVSPVVYMRRTATTATELGTKQIAAGDKVVMYYGSANRDSRAFTEPDTLDITRWPNEHVAFGGGGPHFCLGAHLGRLEIAAMLRQILSRLGGLRVAEKPEWLRSNFISGVRHLPVEFTPGEKLAG
ncbi:MAG TPA: cytochrome P450 [Acidimicrobiales bacterium]|nr:cytochrome P450 [Acidimicrobiales bacterium]